MAHLKCLEILQTSKLLMVSSHPRTLLRCPLQVAAKFDSRIRLTTAIERKGRGHADSRFLSEIVMSLLKVQNMLPKTTKSQLSRRKLHQAPVALQSLLNNPDQMKRIWLRKEPINFLKSWNFRRNQNSRPRSQIRQSKRPWSKFHLGF